MKSRTFRKVAVATAILSGATVVASTVDAFTPGTAPCSVSGSHWASPGEKKGYAAFNSQPNCTAYIRVVVICKRDNGGTMYYYGGSKSWGSTSTFDCDSNGTYNNWGSLYGHQTSGTP